MGKRGLSAVVTTLIMILLTLVAVGMIWLVITNILKSSADEADIGKLTLKLTIEKVKIDGDNVSITVKRSPGKGEMTSIKFVLKNGTDSVIVVKEGSLVELESKTFVINTTQEGITLPITEISMYAITKTGTGKEVPGLEYKYDVGTGTGLSPGGCTDIDGDGYKIEGGSCGTTDCNDNDANINPGATEICNSVDDNCNGQVDEGVLNTYYQDLDSDGYGNSAVSSQACTAPSGYVSNNTDCNDADVNEHPNQVWYKDIDNDVYSDGTNTTQCTRPINYKVQSELTAIFGDCNDSNLNINPGATEICNLIDDDCDSSIDEGGVCVTFLKTWPGFVSWWRFEGNANDEISGNTGIVNGGATPTTGKYGQAYQFDGVDDYVTINNINLINNTGNTFIAWVKPNGTQDALDVISLQSGIFGLRISSSSANKIEYYVFNKTTSFVSFASNSALTSNNWNLIAGVYNFGGDNMTFYLNGNHDNSRASIGGLRSNNGFDGDIDGFQVGGGQANRYLKGFIDEVMIWNRSLSASEIQQIYNMNLSSG